MSRVAHLPIRVVETVAELEALEAANDLRGLFRMPIEVYHGGPGVSSTALRALLRSPAHMRAELQTGKDSPALRRGRLAHMRVLEPELYAATIAVESEAPIAPERPAHLKGVRRNDKKSDCPVNVWEASWRPHYEAELVAWTERTAGKTPISVAEAEHMEALAASYGAHPLASRIISGALCEVSVFWRDVETGVLCKARADILRDELVADLKTCRDARPLPFQRDITKYGYHVAAAFYLDGFSTVCDIGAFGWVALEESAPHAICLYTADATLLASGRIDYRNALFSYRACREKDEWPAYPAEFVNMTLPAWHVGGEV